MAVPRQRMGHRHLFQRIAPVDVALSFLDQAVHRAQVAGARADALFLRGAAGGQQDKHWKDMAFHRALLGLWQAARRDARQDADSKWSLKDDR